MNRYQGEMEKYYAARASQYEKVYDTPERSRDIARLEALLTERFANLRVLEVACGTGFWTRRVAAKAAEIVATDAVRNTIEVASVHSVASNVRYLVEDAYRLSASLGKFQGGYAGLWLSHVPIDRRQEFLLSLHARLEPGSPIMIFDNNRAQLKKFPIAGTDEAGNTYQIRVWEDGTSYRVLKNFPTEEELRAMVSGFATRVEYEEMDHFWLFSFEV
jgi:demethylmenaquinone methyltransferase/2-methoxy-6-polyprenyl-1,4-benzoquinol methylase